MVTDGDGLGQGSLARVTWVRVGWTSHHIAVNVKIALNHVLSPNA